MTDRIVINTGPLIAIAKAQLAEVIGELPYHFVCPPAVRAELDEGAAQGHVEIRAAWLAIVPLRNAASPVSLAVLDAGEAAVIQLALDEGIGTVCIDERAGRRLAAAVGLTVVGTLGLILRAKREGLLPSVRPVLDRLQAVGIWYDGELIAQVLRAANEQ